VPTAAPWLAAPPLNSATAAEFSPDGPTAAGTTNMPFSTAVEQPLPMSLTLRPISSSSSTMTVGAKLPSTTTSCALTFVWTLVTLSMPSNVLWTAALHFSQTMSTAYSYIMATPVPCRDASCSAAAASASIRGYVGSARGEEGELILPTRTAGAKFGSLDSLWTGGHVSCAERPTVHLVPLVYRF
jgi:hypothetical protein